MNGIHGFTVEAQQRLYFDADGGGHLMPRVVVLRSDNGRPASSRKRMIASWSMSRSREVPISDGHYRRQTQPAMAARFDGVEEIHR